MYGTPICSRASTYGPQHIEYFHIQTRFAGWKAARFGKSVDYFRLLFAYTDLMFPGPESSKLVVVECKGCHENIPRRWRACRRNRSLHGVRFAMSIDAICRR